MPKAGGGPYWPQRLHDLDWREFKNEEDSSDRLRLNSLAEILRILQNSDVLSDEVRALPMEALLKRCVPLLAGTRLMNSIEFGRAVHAEMAAITEAARRGVPIRGTTLYSTTFPCHNCARHIVASGISRVIYIEPYAKSLASELHEDSIAVEASAPNSSHVVFQPFVGVAPRQYMALFQMVERKIKGRRANWNKPQAMPRLYPPIMRYLEWEVREMQRVKAAIDSPRPTSTPSLEALPDES